MTEANPIRVLIADDHHMIRDGLRTFLANYPDILVIGEAANGKQAIELNATLNPEIILMDLVMPVLDGTSATKLIHAQDPDVRILALTSFQERHLVEETVQAGAAGFLYKDCTPEELVQAIRNLSRGRSALAPLATEALMQSVAHPAELGADLSKRERQVLVLLAKGKTNAEIAKQLNLSPATVGFHVGNIFAKLGATNRTEAANIARKHHLIPPE